MANIKVKLGGCGIVYTDAHGNARHALKTPEHGPFECDDAQAARLVGLGVAEYVAAEGMALADDQQGTGEGEKLTGHLDAAQLETMTNEQLKNLAADMGVDVTGCKKKADYIAVIVAVEVEVEPDAIVDDPDEDDPDNDLPDLSAADPE